MDNSQLIEKLTRIKLLADECLRDLAVSQHQRRVIAAPARAAAVRAEKIDFTLPLRPFVKKYSLGMSSSKKFTLLVAHLVGGDLRKEVALTEIERAWNSVTALLGVKKFNRFFTQEAKDNDWVVTAKKGMYSLRPSWKEIFDNA